MPTLEPPRRAISELTYGPSPLRLQVGTLTGPQVAIPDTTLYPWRVSAALRITLPDRRELFGTGWFIGPRAVITAAHAVYPREPEGYVGWVSRIELTPAQIGGPYVSATSDTFQCPVAWQREGDERADYGVVLLAEPLGGTVGMFGYEDLSDGVLQTAMANVAGFPVSPPDGGAYGRQWYAAGSVEQCDASFVYYRLGTLDGESGGCVYRNVGDDSYAMAIHTGARGGVDRGLRIVDPVYANLQTWAAMGA